MHAHVRTDELCGSAAFADAADHGLSEFDLDVGDHKPRTFPGEQPTGGSAYAGCAAGDDDDFGSEPSVIAFIHGDGFLSAQRSACERS